MSYSQITDERKRTISQIHYEYDSFGRRILSQDSASSASRTMYDGLSFDTIKIAPVHPNGRYTDYAVEGRQYQSGEFVQESETDRYFHISDDDAGGRGSRIGDSGAGYNFVSEFDGAERVYISLGGTPVAVSQLSDGIASSRGVSYYGTDSQGSVRSETDWYGELKESYSYDVMGSCLCDGAMPEFGYCGKRQGRLTGLYDYGFRDYAPSVGRFTTVDPVRDGVNWFGYCGGDAVNWVDLWGLTAEKDEREITVFDPKNAITIEKIDPNDPNGWQKWKAQQYAIGQMGYYNDMGENPSGIYYYVYRDVQSYDISTDRSSPKNFYLDSAVLYNSKTGVVAEFDKMQTVANYPSTNAENKTVDICYNDTVAAGTFDYKVYTTTNVAVGTAGVITNATTIDGRKIDKNGYTENAKSEGRGLGHGNRPYNKKDDYETPYSKQCFIMPSNDNERLHDTLKRWGVKTGESIKGFVYNVIK